MKHKNRFVSTRTNLFYEQRFTGQDFKMRLLICLFFVFSNNLMLSYSYCLKIPKKENQIYPNEIEQGEAESILKINIDDFKNNSLVDFNNPINISMTNSAREISSFSEKNKNNNTIACNFNNTSMSSNISNITADDKVDADIGVLDNKLENLSKMLENLENIKTANKEEAKDNNITIDALIPNLNTDMYSNPQINQTIIQPQEENKQESTSINIDNKVLELEFKDVLNIINPIKNESSLIMNITDINKNPKILNDYPNEQKSHNNEHKDQQYHSILMQSLAIFEEIEMNSDQRYKRSQFQICLLVSFMIYFYLFLTWKLSQKHQKFPSNILNDFFFSNLLLIILIYITHKTNKNLLFQRIGIAVMILLSYNNIFLNSLYFCSVIFLTKCKTNSEIQKVIFIIQKVKAYFYFLLCLGFFRILYYSNMQIKNCFIGYCVVDRSQRYYLQIIPKKVEIYFLCFLFGLDLILRAIENFKTNKQNKKNFNMKKPLLDADVEKINYQKEFQKKESKDMDSEPTSKLNNINNDFRFYNFFSSLIKKNNTINKIFLLEMFYFIYTSFDFFTQYYKFFYFNNFRFEDYSTIHDFYPIVISFLFLSFLGLNESDLYEWYMAFKDENLVEENKEADELVEKIIKLKIQIYRSK